MSSSDPKKIVSEVVAADRERRTALEPDDRAYSIAKTFADESRARDGQVPMPPQREDASGKLRAAVESSRPKLTAGAATTVNVHVWNDSDEDVFLAMVELYGQPASGFVAPAAVDHTACGRPGLRIEAHADLHGSYTVTFLSPQVGAPWEYVIGARIRFSDGRIIEAETTRLSVNPIIRVLSQT